MLSIQPPLSWRIGITVAMLLVAGSALALAVFAAIGVVEVLCG